MPDDFVKIDAGAGGSQGGGGTAAGGTAAGGTGGTGAGSGACSPFTEDTPADCDATLLANPDSCCVAGRSCGAGDCVEGVCQPAQLAESAQAEAIDVLLFDDRVIFTTGYGDRVLSAPLAGGAATILYEGIGDGAATNDLTSDGERVFFTRFNRGQIWSVDPDVGPASAELVADNGDHQAWWGHIAVDGTHVYWVSQDDIDHTPAVWYAPKEGGGAPLTVTVGGFPASVAVDATHVYWSDAAAGEVRRCALTALPDCPAVETVAGAPNGAADLFVEDGRAFWVSTAGLHSAAAAGGATTTLAATGDLRSGLAYDATHAYWTATDANTVYRVPLDGSEAAAPIASAVRPLGIAVGCETVVFTTFPSAPPAYVFSLAK